VSFSARHETRQRDGGGDVSSKPARTVRLSVVRAVLKPDGSALFVQIRCANVGENVGEVESYNITLEIPMT